MSSSSDSEDENIKLMLEATDTSFLTDSMFKEQPKEEPVASIEVQKSVRYLEDNDQTAIDFVPPPTVQKLMSKKLALLIKEQIEFVSPADKANESKKKKPKSRVRLLSDSESYTKSYEEFEFETVGPQKKPKIQRRDVDQVQLNEDEKIRCSAVNGDDILSGKGTESWSPRKKGKVFHYKAGYGSNKMYHLIEQENEFTKLRRKNKWDESKIRTTKFPTKKYLPRLI